MSATRIPRASARRAYETAQLWKQRCLLDQQSLFDDRPGYRTQELQDLRAAFVDQPDDSSDTFLVKLQRQLDGASDDVVLLAAELLFVHFLIAREGVISGSKKRQVVQAVLDFRPGLPGIPADLTSALDGGLVNPGQAFLTYRWKQFAYLIELCLHLSRQRPEERQRVLTDARAYLDLAEQLPEDGAYIQRYALEHLLFPDEYTAVVSRDHRKRVLETWPQLAGDDGPPSVRLSRLVRQLPGRRNGFVDLYRAPLVREWQARSKQFARAAAWARVLLEHQDVEALRAAELRHAPPLAAARQLLDRGDHGWPAALADAARGPGGLAPETAQLLEDWTGHDPAAGDVLRQVWAAPAPFEVVEALDRAGTGFPLEISGPVVAVGSFLCGAVHPSDGPAWRPRTVEQAYAVWDAYRPSGGAPPAEVYEYWLLFLDQVRDDLERDGLPLPDRAATSGLVRALLEQDPPAEWAPAQAEALRRWRGGKPIDPLPATPEPGRPPTIHVPAQEQSLAELADALLVDVPWLEEVVALVRDKKQAVFYGPPGTGKTYLARLLARWLAGDESRVRLVQFHPSYAYEDFVEGLRPREGESGFRLVDGPLKRLARAAAADPDHLHVLLVDELNRGNVARVFGELYFLLEYRGESAELLYSSEPFALPDNLVLLGTMNSADRSIALLDTALRRRFYFVPFLPTEEPVQGLLRRYLQRTAPDLLWVADVVDRANALLDDPTAAIGPSHFLRPDLSATWVRRAWEHGVLPTLEDRFFGQPAQLAAFDLDVLRGAAALDGDDGADATSA